MTLRWIDVTMPLEDGMPAWPGDVPFSLDATERIARGGGCNLSSVTLSVHAGTHIDAPWHFIDGAPGVDELDPALFFGPARVLEIMGKTAISAEDLGTESLPPRLLLKTMDTFSHAREPFREDFVALRPCAAQRLVDEGVALVGIDYLSIGLFGQEGDETHRTLLEAGIIVVEGLMLGSVPPGDCGFVALPLRIAGAEAAPCRAFVARHEEESS